MKIPNFRNLLEARNNLSGRKFILPSSKGTRVLVLKKKEFITSGISWGLLLSHREAREKGYCAKGICIQERNCVELYKNECKVTYGSIKLNTKKCLRLFSLLTITKEFRKCLV